MRIADGMSHFLKRLRWWVPATARWFPDLIGYFAPYVAPILLILVLCVVVRLFWPCHAQQAIREQAMRWIGGLFQLAGVITIVLKLRAAQRQFQQQTLKRILERRPRFRILHTVISATGAALGIATGRAEVHVALGPQATLEQRLAMLEDNYTKLVDGVGSLGKEMRGKTDELSSKLNAEVASREAGDKRVEEQLKETAVGSIHLDAWGVIFFVIGIIAGTASPEIAAVFGAVSCK